MFNKNPSRKAQLMGKALYAKRAELRALLDQAEAGEALSNEEVFRASALRASIIQGKIELTKMGFDPENLIVSTTLFEKQAGDKKEEKRRKQNQADKDPKFAKSPERGAGMHGMGSSLKFWR